MYMYIIALFYPTGLKIKLKFIRSKMMVNCVQLVIIIPWHLGKKIEVNLCKKKNKQTNNQGVRWKEISSSFSPGQVRSVAFKTLTLSL